LLQILGDSGPGARKKCNHSRSILYGICAREGERGINVARHAWSHYANCGTKGESSGEPTKGVIDTFRFGRRRKRRGAKGRSDHKKT